MSRGDLSSALTMILIISSMFAIAVGIASTYLIYKASKQEMHYSLTYAEDYDKFLASIKNVSCNSKKGECSILLKNGEKIRVKYGQKVHIDNVLIMCRNGKLYLIHR